VKLSEFLNQLFREGTVVVPRQIADFEEEDLRASVLVIRKFYEADRLEISSDAPPFDEPAAMWAAQYLFHAVQFVLLRELGTDVMAVYLKPYAGEITPAAIYSVDLLFRYFGPLFKFSSGISPDDPLVVLLKDTAMAWPFSSVGLSILCSANTDIIFSHPSLKYAYVDRIIEHRDSSRLTGEKEIATLNEIMGLHQAQLWPGFELIAQSTEN
jgi:hypothetical protein